MNLFQHTEMMLKML